MLTIWLVTATLASASIAMTALLIAARAIAAHQNGDRRELGDTARRALLDFVTLPDELVLLERLRPIDRGIIADKAREILGLVRGDLTRRLLNVLNALDLAKQEQIVLRRGFLPSRLRAAEFLAHFGDEASEASLRRALNDRSIEVRVTAAISLARRNALRTEADIRSALTRSASSSKRIVELFEIIAKDQRDLVVSLARRDNLPAELRALALDGLCRTRQADLIGLLDELLKTSTEPPVIAALVRGVAVLKHPRSLEIVQRYLCDVDWTLRLAAVEAVGLLGVPDDDVLEGLGIAMSDKEWPVRLAASSSLVALGPKGLGRLKEIVSDPQSPGRRIRAAESALALVHAHNV